MRRALTNTLPALALALPGCLLVPENEARLTLNYILLVDNGGPAVVLCDVARGGPVNGFIHSAVATLVITGVSSRGLTVRRPVDCFYEPDDVNVDRPEEVGLAEFSLPADTYTELRLSLEDLEGNLIPWTTSLGGQPEASVELLSGTPISLSPGGSADLGPILAQQGIDGAVLGVTEIPVFPFLP